MTGSRERLPRVVLGDEPPDLVIHDAAGVFDSVSGEFLAGRSLWLSGGRIARVAPASDPVPSGVPVLDAHGLFLVPGLIDGHTHLNRIFLPEYVRALLPTGTTTAVLESMELAETGGIPAIRLMAEGVRDQPLRLFYTLPVLAGLIEDEARDLPSPGELATFLDDPVCLGLGEVYWANALGPGPQGQRVRELIGRTLAAGKVVEGHTAGARGTRLEAYCSLGISSCHEPIDVEEALALYRMGLLVMLRHGGIRRDLENLRPLFDLPLDFRRFALVTDSVDPERLGTWGYLDQVVREALGLGIPPALVYRLTSTNLAEHFRLDHEIGSLAPGRWADLVAIPHPEVFEPAFVMVGGRLVHRAGETLAEARQVSVPAPLLDTIRLDPEGVLRSVGGLDTALPSGALRVIEMVTNLVTRETIWPAGEVEDSGVVPVIAVERTKGERAFRGLVAGLGLREAAYATSMTWDSPDLLVLGRDEQGALTALRRLRQTGGGAVLARGGEVVAEMRAPLAGVASTEPLSVIRRELRDLAAALREFGARWEDPLLAVDTLTTPAIPQLRMTHRGYVRLRDGALLSLEA
jgi:adenine deaminase